MLTEEFYYSATLVLFLYLFFWFIKTFDKRISYLYLIALLSVLQWLVGPILYYIVKPNILFEANIMQLGPLDYFTYMFPATLSFVIGLLMFSPKRTKLKLRLVEASVSSKLLTAYLLIILGLLAFFLEEFVPVSIGFIVYMLKNMLYIGALYLYFSGKWKRSIIDKYILYFAIVLVFGVSFTGGMFGELVFWLLLTGLLIAPRYKLSFLNKTKYIGLAVLFVAIIQIVKPIIRLNMWYGDGSWSSVVSQIFSKKTFSKDLIFSDASLEYNIARINQGSIISRTMTYVPKREPFSNGQTVIAATIGSFVPRIIWPSKPVAGQALFERFTGLNLESASMGISAAGEAYVNFGKRGGVVFLFFYGLLFSFLFNGLVYLAKFYPTILIWLPFVFLHAVQAETDISRTFGFAMRICIFMAAMHFSFKYILGLRL